MNCNKCGHEFLCDRSLLASKKPFAKAKKAVAVKAKKNRREAIQNMLSDTPVVKVVCLCSALAIACVCAWLFYDASEEKTRTSFLCMLLQPQQKAFAVFFACLAGVLFACAGRRHRALFILLGILLAGSVIALPYVYPVQVNPSLLGGSDASESEDVESSEPSFIGAEHLADMALDKGVTQYGEDDLKPLFSTIERKETEGVLGVWVVGVNAVNQPMVQAYLQRMTQSQDEPMFYDRKGKGGGLFVITPTPLTFKEFVDVVGNMGSVTLQDKDRFFVEVMLNRDKFESRPASAALQDAQHQYFVLANLKELSCLDIRRVISAARRLAPVQPDKLRNEVSSTLVALLKEPWGRDAEYVTALASALVVWAEHKDEEAQRVVYYVVGELKKAECEIPPSMLRYLLHGPQQEATDLLLEVWKEDPKQWEEECVRIGPTGETAIVTVLSESEDYVLKRSAARILGDIGTESSLKALKQFVNDQDSELRLSAELSINLIEKRLGMGASASAP